MNFPRILVVALGIIALPALALGQTTPAPTELEKCNAERLRLSQRIIELRKRPETTPSDTAALEQCKRRVEDQERVNRSMIASEDELRATVGSLEKQVATYKKTTGDVAALEEKLAAATARGDRLAADLDAADAGLEKAAPRAALADKLEKDLAIYKTHSGKLENDLAAAQAEIEKLRARLARYDIPADAGFAYHLDSSYKSFLTAEDIPAILKFPSLEAARCQAALDWLDAQAGDDALLIKAIWVKDDEDWKICASAGTGAEIRQAAPDSEAHLVFFR